MSLERLAVVELQLIMQHCDQQSLLSLARCSHFTFAAASHPVAWRHCPPLIVRRLAPDLPARLADSPLLRHCTLALDLSLANGNSPRCESSSSPPPITEGELTAMTELPRLRSLDTRGRSLEPADFAALLQRPVLSDLTALYVVKEQLDSECLRLLPLHQSGLRTLHVEAPGFHSPEFFAPLPPLPSLPDLTGGAARNLERGNMRAVDEYATLPRLALDTPSQEDSQSVLSPTLRQLESLSLRKLWVDGPDSWVAAIGNLPALRSLYLRTCSKVDGLLETMTILHGVRGRLSGPYEPSVSRLEPLLTALPGLAELELELPPQPQPRAHGGVSDEPAVSTDLHLLHWQRVHQQFLALQQRHPQRVQVRISQTDGGS